MNTTIPIATIIAMVVEILLCVGIPIALLLVWKAKKKVNLLPALVGAITFLVFALLLEQIAHLVFLRIDSPLSQAIKGNVWLFALYGGLAAGIFEETGRFVAFKFFLKKHTSKETAITYGIGHGGIEAILIVGVTMMMYLVMALKINAIGIDSFLATVSPEKATALSSAIDGLLKLTPLVCFWAVFERISALILHISLSVVVFTAVNSPSKRFLFPLAILLHALIDFPAAFYQFGMLTNLAILEVLVFAIAVGTAVLATFISNKA